MGIFDRWLKPKKSKDLEVIDSDKSTECEDTAIKVSSVYTTMQSVDQSVQKAAAKFAKPTQYDRNVLDSGTAKRQAKNNVFNSGEPVIDPYTGNELCLTKAEAKMRFGDDWASHLAEPDHNVSLKERYDQTKNNPWLTNDDIKASSNNIDENIVVTSRKFNNAKRSRSNEEFVKDSEYLDKTGVVLTESQKKEAIKRQRQSEQAMARRDFADSTRNLIETGHNAGMDAAQNAGSMALTMSGITNITAVIRGDKDVEEAVTDTLKTTGQVAATAYVQGGASTVITHSLTHSSSKFLKALGQSNVPANIISTVMMTGDILKQYADGEITTQECILQLGERGLSTVNIGYSAAVGQALIPIPIVGAAVGAMVGSALTSTYYNQLVYTLQKKQIEHQERLRIISECEQATKQMRAYQAELETYLENYFQDYQNCFDESLNMIYMSFQLGDANGIIAGANQITRKLGGKVHYDTMDEFKDFLFDDSTDVL